MRTTARGVDGLLVVSRYLLIDPDGKVLKVDKMQWREDGHFSIELPEGLPPGQYTVVLGIFLDGNSLQPSTRIVHFSVGAAGSTWLERCARQVVRSQLEQTSTVGKWTSWQSRS